MVSWSIHGDIPQRIYRNLPARTRNPNRSLAVAATTDRPTILRSGIE